MEIMIHPRVLLRRVLWKEFPRHRGWLSERNEGINREIAGSDSVARRDYRMGFGCAHAFHEKAVFRRSNRDGYVERGACLLLADCSKCVNSNVNRTTDHCDGTSCLFLTGPDRP